MRLVQISLLGGALAVLPAAANAAPVLIDDFVTPQDVGDTPGGGIPRLSELATATSIGGFRDLESEIVGGVDGILLTRLSTNGQGLDRLAFSNNAGTTGRGTVTWDGEDNDASQSGVDINGLGGLDLTDGGTNNRLEFGIEQADLGLTLSFTVWEQGVAPGVTVEQTFTQPILESAPSLTVTFLFADFLGIDFTNIGALQLTLTGPANADGQISSISAVGAVPVPATLPLLLAALAGIGYVARRR